jgi:hypothetical protein
MMRSLLSLKRFFVAEKAGNVRYQYPRQNSQEESMDYYGLAVSPDFLRFLIH